ncbi:MAG: efflux RND transporter permease subunit, partial [Bradyrhizobium sp.]|nr:efflux RND transporter permease subunit [Bradyrhizobium sp.]
MVKSLIQFGLTRSAIVVLGLLVFCAAGIAAFLRLNIEAYPNPAPVILEITAQASGLSAEEMEKYYTIPMEVGLYPTPGVVNIRSTSFYGLAFVRVTFKYGVDYYFALTQAANSIQQNIQLPGNLVPTIQQSSLIGEIYRYRLVGPPNFGLTNLRTLQDYVVTRRLMTIPGVVQVNAWGGTTKQFNVDADLQKLESYNITVPQLVAALGNANVNVGGREITIGQQSVNIRGIGLIDSGGTDDITKGNRVADIENIVLTQSAGLPIQIKDVARVSVGYVPRLGIAGKDKDDDIAAAIVVMGRTQHTNDIIPKVQAEVARINSDGTLSAGVRIVPYYDRSALVGVTTHTVLHNLVFGCLLVFAIQWIFLGDLRSALIVSANIPFALFFAIIILVLRDEDANLLSLGAVDFGIIVDSAVIMMENVFRNLQSPPEARQLTLQRLSEGYWGVDPTVATHGHPAAVRWSERLRMIYVSALQVDKAVFFTAAITVTAFVPLFTMQGVEGQIFGPMARTYGYALAGALLATFTVTPVLAALLLPRHVEEVETVIVRALRRVYTPVLAWSQAHVRLAVAAGLAFLML